MKRINIPSIFFCLIMAVGCSQDELATETPDNGNATGQQITATASMPNGGVDTRLVYEDETNDQGSGKLIVKWSESGEKIYLYNSTQNTSSTLLQKKQFSEYRWQKDRFHREITRKHPKRRRTIRLLQQQHHRRELCNDQSCRARNKQHHERWHYGKHDTPHVRQDHLSRRSN